MSLITPKEMAKAINLDKFGIFGNFIGWSLMEVLRISTINKIYNKNKHLNDLEFFTAILEDLEIDFEIPEEDLRRIPKDGPFITVSNHPLGGIDGIILLKILSEIRPDFKVIANFLLHRIEPMKSYVMPVNPFENHKDAKSSVAGIKNALMHIKEGKPMGIFPAGEVSTQKDENLLVDKPWEAGAVRLIQKAKVPVIPIYFHAKNSRLFYLLSKINGTLRTAKLPSELLKQKDKTIKVRIGNPIPVKNLDEYKDLNDLSDFLRRKTYMLSNPYVEDSSKLIIPNSLKLQKTPKEIVKGKGDNALIKEVDKLRKKGARTMKSKEFEIFFAEAKDIPNILHEIGRLREITFREVGEGTNEEIDLDKYDHYYRHLFLWDSINNKIVGAYRMGLGSDIYKKYGIEGFYINSLFRFDPELHKLFEESIELGRAFVVGEYQLKPMPLFLLWKGIVHVTVRHPELKYLTGGVSISNQFSDFSKSLMIEFMKSHYYDPYLAQYIRPKKEYKVKLKDTDKDFIFDVTKADLNKFDKIIDEIEPGNLRMPVLIKKYIKQNARLVAFNVDPKFNNAIDGLIFMKIADIPESTMKPIMEEFLKELENKSEQE
ncbi:GNAT family N-acyltransferase [Aureivirga marina]|uniref:GNAT family N-acyltransferase n=1 Tax=Aureivirga marina TaxID=1182451 RepID=UPI0018CB0392|nr:lysophospholipid acyltransferase family protein [Aureivirga marina]